MNNKLLLTLILILCFVLSTKAQDKSTETVSDDNSFRPYPDSIRVEFPEEKALVIFKFKNISSKDSLLQSFPNLLNSILKDAYQGIADTSINHKLQVSFDNGDRKISINEQAKTTTDIVSRNEQIIQLLPPGWEIEINTQWYKIYVYAPSFSSLQALTKESFDIVESNIKEEINRQKLNRHALNSRLVVQDNTIISSDHQRKSVIDLLEFYPIFGVSYINETLYPTIEAVFALKLRDRSNRPSHQIEFSYYSLFYNIENFDGNIESVASRFFNLSYNINLNKNSTKESWFGFGAGILRAKNDDFFEGRITKFFINKSIGNFKFSPQLYLSSNFRKSFVGFEISFKL